MYYTSTSCTVKHGVSVTLSQVRQCHHDRFYAWEIRWKCSSIVPHAVSHWNNLPLAFSSPPTPSSFSFLRHIFYSSIHPCYFLSLARQLTAKIATCLMGWHMLLHPCCCVRVMTNLLVHHTPKITKYNVSRTSKVNCQVVCFQHPCITPNSLLTFSLPLSLNREFALPSIKSPIGSDACKYKFDQRGPVNLTWRETWSHLATQFNWMLIHLSSSREMRQQPFTHPLPLSLTASNASPLNWLNRRLHEFSSSSLRLHWLHCCEHSKGKQRVHDWYDWWKCVQADKKNLPWLNIVPEFWSFEMR